jgi:hypothetical protein
MTKYNKKNTTIKKQRNVKIRENGKHERRRKTWDKRDNKSVKKQEATSSKFLDILPFLYIF